MITAIIFFAHFLFALIIFTKKWQQEGMWSSFLNLGLILILFAVGWTLTGLLAKLFMKPEGLGTYFDRDTFSITTLTIIEIIFYRIYYKEASTADDTGKL